MREPDRRRGSSAGDTDVGAGLAMPNRRCRTVRLEAMVVGIPARDEQDRIDACVRSVLRAAECVSLPVVLVVAADRCRDLTEERARLAFATARTSAVCVVVPCDHGSAGAARSVAIGHALALTEVRASRCWIATTDADTVVAHDWLRTHQRWAEQGADGIAGLVDVRWEAGTPSMAASYRASIEPDGVELGHGHVHGANLGLRADLWCRVGGCGSSTVGEDHELWRRLRVLGADLIGVDDLRVETSGRLHGRVRNGFAGFLRDLGSMVDAAGP